MRNECQTTMKQESIGSKLNFANDRNLKPAHIQNYLFLLDHVKARSVRNFQESKKLRLT